MFRKIQSVLNDSDDEMDLCSTPPQEEKIKLDPEEIDDEEMQSIFGCIKAVHRVGNAVTVSTATKDLFIERKDIETDHVLMEGDCIHLVCCLDSDENVSTS